MDGHTWRHETDLLVEQSGKETETGIIDGTGDSRGRDGAAPRARRGLPPWEALGRVYLQIATPPATILKGSVCQFRPK